MGDGILVVEDDRPIRNILSRRLEMAGYEVTECTDGRNAANRLDDGLDPALAILDVMMPRLDGTRLLRMIRNDEFPVSPGLPVIMVTSRSREADVLDGFESGADDYVTKPFRGPELIARVDSQLEGRQSA